MDSEKVIKRDGEYVLHTYNRNPIVLEKGHGLRAAGPEGQQYLDFTSGIGVNSLGYCDLDWAEAVSEQAHKLQHTSNLYYTAPCGKLAKKLCKRTGMSKVFFGNSGAEANEGAIKAARKYSVDHYRKDRTTVITLVNSFHGRTIATLTATGQEVFHNYFGPFNEGFLYAPAGDIEALDELVDRTTCAVMLELIQGEGGVMALDPDYVQAVRKLCDEKDLVLIVDEVQTGVGRTGTFLCCEHYNLKPDVVTLAKGLGGGLPIGAVLMNEKVAEGMGPGTHGSTFGGNPVVCAGANVVVDRMDQSFLANVNERAVQLRAQLAGKIAAACGAVGDEHTGNVQRFSLGKRHARHQFIALDRAYLSRFCAQTVGQVGRRLAAVRQQRNRPCHRQQHSRFLERILTLTEHGNVLAAIEKRVTDGAVADAAALKCGYALDFRHCTRRTGCQNDRICVKHAVRSLNREALRRILNTGYLGLPQNCTQTFGLLLSTLEQLCTGNRLNKAEIILDLVRFGQRTTVLIQNGCLHAGAYRVNRSTQSRRSTANDNNVGHSFVLSKLKIENGK